MQIGDKYRIESDELNVTVLERHINEKTKKEYYTPIRYYSSVKNALKGMSDLELHKTGLSDLKKVVEKQDEIYKLIEGLGVKNDSRRIDTKTV